MRRLSALLALAAGIALAGCSNRDRSNPLDPANPQTGGRPSGFNAVAGYAAVRLTWDPRPDLAIDGFLLYRYDSTTSAWQTLGGVRPTTASVYLDSGLPNGRRQRYRLDYVITGTPAGRPAEDDATPGASRPWVADPGAGELVRLTPDGRDVWSRESGLGSVYAIAVDPADGFVWASARFDGILWAYDPWTPSARPIPGIGAPYALAVGPLDHSAWVTDLSGGLAHFYRDGTAANPGYIGLFDDPIDVATCKLDGSVWVVERGGNRVRHLSALGAPVGTAFLDHPARVAVDSLTRVAYVTSLDMGRIWRIAENGGRVDSTSAALGPIGIAIDRARGRVWVADAGGARVLGLNIATLAVEVTVQNVGTPYDLSVDSATGEVWVVSRTERIVLRLAPDGTRLDLLGGFADPVQVRVDPGVY